MNTDAHSRRVRRSTRRPAVEGNSAAPTASACTKVLTLAVRRGRDGEALAAELHAVEADADLADGDDRDRDPAGSASTATSANMAPSTSTLSASGSRKAPLRVVPWRRAMHAVDAVGGGEHRPEDERRPRRDLVDDHREQHRREQQPDDGDEVGRRGERGRPVRGVRSMRRSCSGTLIGPPATVAGASATRSGPSASMTVTSANAPTGRSTGTAIDAVDLGRLAVAAGRRRGRPRALRPGDRSVRHVAPR